MKTNKTIAAFFAVVFISGWLNVLLGSETHNLATNTTNHGPQPALMVCDNPGMLSITENNSNMHLPTTSNRNNNRSDIHGAIVVSTSSDVFSTFTGSGNVHWATVEDPTAPSENNQVARSGLIGHSQSSKLTATLNAPGAGSVSFWWRVSSEPNFDQLTFELIKDAETLETESISGNVGWHRMIFDIPSSGEYTLEWEYSKDGSITQGQDRGWIDELEFHPITADEKIRFRPAFATASQPGATESSTVTIEMEILDKTELHNFDFVGFNADIVLDMVGSGTSTYSFVYVQSSDEHGNVVGSARLERSAEDPDDPDIKLHILEDQYHAEQQEGIEPGIVTNTLRLISYAIPTTAYPGENGVIVAFDLKVPIGIPVGTYTFTIQHMVISDAEGTNLLLEGERSTTGSIQIFNDCVVAFNVKDHRNGPVGNATITIYRYYDNTGIVTSGFKTDGLGTATRTINAGIYKFMIESDCFHTLTGTLTVDNTTVSNTYTLGHTPGDANGNGVVDVIDITLIIKKFLGGVDPVPDEFYWCPVSADANGDGGINVQDVVITVNLAFEDEDKMSLYEGMQSQKAQGYLNPDGIYIESDGTLTAMQFYLRGNNLETLSMASALLSHQIMYRVEGNELVAMFISLNNTPIPEGKVRIIDFEQGNDQLQWGEALAANLIGDPVPVITYTDQPTDVEEPDGFENILVYPNPANDVLWVELVNSPETPVRVSLINIHGQLILSHTIKDSGATKTAMNIAQLPAGTYMLRLESAYTSTTKKIVIK